jgi:hypothetical protein
MLYLLLSAPINEAGRLFEISTFLHKNKILAQPSQLMSFEYDSHIASSCYDSNQIWNDLFWPTNICADFVILRLKESVAMLAGIPNAINVIGSQTFNDFPCSFLML